MILLVAQIFAHGQESVRVANTFFGIPNAEKRVYFFDKMRYKSRQSHCFRKGRYGVRNQLRGCEAPLSKHIFAEAAGLCGYGRFRLRGRAHNEG